jgi:hypothetical protein
MACTASNRKPQEKDQNCQRSASISARQIKPPQSVFGDAGWTLKAYGLLATSPAPPSPLAGGLGERPPADSFSSRIVRTSSSRRLPVGRTRICMGELGNPCSDSISHQELHGQARRYNFLWVEPRSACPPCLGGDVGAWMTRDVFKLLAMHLAGNRWEEINLASAEYILEWFAKHLPGSCCKETDLASVVHVLKLLAMRQPRNRW